jgi:hypothetical protein
VVDNDNDEDEEYEVLIGDLGMCEFTINKRRAENEWLPREPKHKKVWGLYPREYSECYDILYFLDTFESDLEELGKHGYMIVLWEYLEKQFPDFQRREFFTKQGRMNKFIPLTHEHTETMCSVLEKLLPNHATDNDNTANDTANTSQNNS